MSQKDFKAFTECEQNGTQIQLWLACQRHPLLPHPHSKMEGGDLRPWAWEQVQGDRGLEAVASLRGQFSPPDHEVDPSGPMGWILEDTTIPFKVL